MPQLARNLIDAIQNTLLDGLVFRLLNVLIVPIGMAALPDGASVLSELFAVSFLLAALAATVIAWLLGIFANRLPRPASTPFERLQRSQRSGFDAWSDPPKAGLAPPRFLRRLVAFLSGANHWLFWPAFIGWISGMIGLLVIKWASIDWLSSDGLWLGRQADSIFWAVIVLGVVLAFLAWGNSAHQRLNDDSKAVAE